MTKATTIRGLVVWTTTLLVFGMLAAASIGVAAAAPSVSIDPTETTGLSPGSTFSISVSVDSGTATMRAAEVYLNYDSDVLQVNSVNDGDLFAPFMKLCDYGTPGVVEYAMLDDGGAPYAPAAGTLMTVNFEVKGSAPDGTSDIALPFVLLKDENKDEITGVSVTPGTVTVGAATPVTVKVSPQEMAGLCQGELFAIDVVVNSGTSTMRAAEVYLNYDSDVLQVNSVNDGDLFAPFMKLCDYGTSGVVEYAMLDDGGAPYAPAAGTLMTVNFEVKGSAPAGTSDITLPFVLLKDENKDEITGVGVTPGTVTVNALVDADGDSYYATPCGDDCDDNDPNVNPGMTEITCNSKDDDCNAATPDNPDGDGDGEGVCDDCNDGDATVWQLLTGYTDSDNDGYGTGSAQQVCSGASLPSGYTTQGGDCDDTNADINPGADEVCDNGYDDDCDGYTDGDDSDCTVDADGDSYYAMPFGDDCDDGDANVNPGKTEVPYNGKDDDCNAATLDDDLDDDGYPIATDCDDTNAAVNPGATEVCNGIDDNCNGLVDECGGCCPCDFCMPLKAGLNLVSVPRPVEVSGSDKAFADKAVVVFNLSDRETCECYDGCTGEWSKMPPKQMQIVPDRAYFVYKVNAETLCLNATTYLGQQELCANSWAMVGFPSLDPMTVAEFRAVSGLKDDFLTAWQWNDGWYPAEDMVPYRGYVLWMTENGSMPGLIA